jgi:hypothetical protein
MIILHISTEKEGLHTSVTVRISVVKVTLEACTGTLMQEQCDVTEQEAAHPVPLRFDEYDKQGSSDASM